MPVTPAHSKSCQKALDTIRELGGTIRTMDAIRAGIHPRTLYRLRDTGELETLSRGVYRLAEQEQISNPDLVIVAKRVPQAIICLVSALAYHEITTQIPHTVSIALPKGAETPRIDYPPISVHRFSEAALKEGFEKHQIDGVSINIYCPEKTLADCFKFRNKLGMDVVLEALKLYKARKNFNLDKLIWYARVCRVEKIMRPYLEATL
ncbi:MAG: type IV toxin-antitoxin system AbiEi family antitoxin domain-containing protein [Gammaproteobacteria bacterium]|nr:type IV toxin-antitoxin system AbiEi family antitoxin domain-containing protein [Pseudomonadales bacterium]